MLVTAFGGGCLAAAIGAVPSFVFTGLTVLAAVFGGDFSSPLINTLSFGSFFGPHVAFAGAVAAAAYAKQRGLIDSGTNIVLPLYKTQDPLTLIIGGTFGVIGYLIQYLLSDVIGTTVLDYTGWTDTVALTVVISAIIARLLFTKSGIIGQYKGEGKRRFFPESRRLTFLVVTGLGIGIAGSGLTVSLGEMAIGSLDATPLTFIHGATSADAAMVLFKNAGTIGFGIAAVALIFVCMGHPLEGFHHIILPSMTTAMIVYAGTLNSILGIVAGGIIGIMTSIFGEVISLTFNSYADSHIDPPACTIAVFQCINFCLISSLIPATGIFA